MSALHESSGSFVSKAILDVIAQELWKWIDEHRDQSVFTLKIWIIRKTFYVRDLAPFAELLLGPHPEPAS